MQFILGIVVGLLIAVVIMATLLFFKAPIEKTLNVASKQIAKAGPRSKGFIVEPLEESEEFRQEIIERNRQAGKDTPIDQLR